MSRTYTHVPYWVAEQRYGKTEHNHQDGVCDAENNSKIEHEPRVALRKHFMKCKKNTFYLIKCSHYCSDTSYGVNEAYNEDNFYATYYLSSKSNHREVTLLSDGSVVKETSFLDSASCENKVFAAETQFWIRDKIQLDRDVKYWSYFDRKFTVESSKSVSHTFGAYIRDESIPCECDSNKARRDYCRKSLSRNLSKKYFNEGYCCDWCETPKKTPGSKHELALFKKAWNSGDHDYDL